VGLFGPAAFAVVALGFDAARVGFLTAAFAFYNDISLVPGNDYPDILTVFVADAKSELPSTS
jgi:hypothetical protein